MVVHPGNVVASGGDGDAVAAAAAGGGSSHAITEMRRLIYICTHSATINPVGQKSRQKEIGRRKKAGVQVTVEEIAKMSTATGGRVSN